MYLRVNVLTIFVLIYTFARVEPRLFENTFDNGLHNLQKQLASHFRITNYREMEMEKFKEVLDNLNILGRLKQLFDPDRALCGICQLLITQIQRRTLTIRNVGEALCNIYITLSTWTVSNFCANIINKNMPVLEYIVNNSKILDPEFGCSVILQNKKCYYPKPALKWKISVPPISQKKIPQGCSNSLEQWYRDHYITFLGVGLVIVLVEFGVLLTTILTCTRLYHHNQEIKENHMNTQQEPESPPSTRETSFRRPTDSDVGAYSNETYALPGNFKHNYKLMNRA
nr:uncharacterized protein LOC111518218 [Leptinotarsa decemlineata]